MAPRLSAVILAAGYSSRMGEMKALLPLGATTVLGRCISLFQECGVQDVAVVTGHRAQETAALARSCGARSVYNPGFASGMFTSIRAGMGGLDPRSAGFFLLPVDIPLVRPGTVRLLADAFAAAPALVVYPEYAGKRGHPPLIATELVPALLDQPVPEGGFRALLAALETQHPAHVLDVAVPDANILLDMDTPEDYAACCLRLARSGFPTLEECGVILGELHPMPEKGLAHGRMVAALAVALCEALDQQCGMGLDSELCRVCGLLHDMAKGSPNHEHQGGRWLQDLGFERAAEIVAAHKDLDWTPEMGITEREVVHLADKLARGSKIVSLAERFAERRALYRNDPAAVQAIDRRYAQARCIAEAIEAQTGLRLEEILSAFPAACRP